jgi:poly [ADP-ribose] polymerase
MAPTSERLIFTDLGGNNNKFWHANLEGTTVKVNWGRVGAVGQFKDYQFGSVLEAEANLRKQVAGKLKKGYTRQHTLVDNAVVPVSSVAKVQINHKNDPETTALIDFLVARNIHKIEGMTTIRLQAGRLTTPLGVVTAAGLDEAEALIGRMATAPSSHLAALANAYLRIVPRDFGRQRVEARDLFGSPAHLKAELDTIETLRAVVKDLDQKASDAGPVVFKTKLEIADKSDFDRINRFYTGSRNRMHASASLRLHKVWNVTIEAMEKAFEKNLGNVRQLWHGTKDSNLLSILKNGYVIPKSGGSVAITGRAFGDGVYFSDQSTKSLNYATGSAPGQRGGGSQRKFMFVNDVAMGREYRPTSTFSGGCPRGYDSTFAKGGGVFLNNEMIVYRTSQINPTHLAEFVS